MWDLKEKRACRWAHVQSPTCFTPSHLSAFLLVFFNTKHKMLGMVWLGINPCGGTSASIFHLFLSLSNNRDEDGVFFCREEEALLPNEAGLLFSHMVPISAPSFISIINSLLYSNPPLLYQSLHMCPCEFWQLN